ncbi:DNA alkylation repair protein [Fibrobacteres bacterium R8-0-B4]
MDFETLSKDMQHKANPEQAVAMKAYMRDQFDYLGLTAPQRRELFKPYLKAAKSETDIDWKFINRCWKEPYREYQYIAVHYLSQINKLLTPIDVPKIKKLITQKSWWDTVDGLDVILGGIAMRFPNVKQTLLEWSLDKNFWLRRAAIDHQLQYKDKTDTKLFEKILVNNLGQTEFFINKAIGWSLREYSKTNPDWVRAFVKKHKASLAPLSVREASKYI